jgi:SpoIID/LytB domain protein
MGMDKEPTISVGIMDRRTEVDGTLNGVFAVTGGASIAGRFRAFSREGSIVLADETGKELSWSASIRLTATGKATFTLFGVAIGKQFHWERPEDQTFRGNLLLLLRREGSFAVINEIPLEDYLQSVVSSEMSAAAPIEFLKAHAILSRSWLMAALKRKDLTGAPSPSRIEAPDPEEVIRWYEREEHDLFDVCADDHCQRYQGITKLFSGRPEEAVSATRGTVITYHGDICDARYGKACGGITDCFDTAWDDKVVPYLRSVSDGPRPLGTIESEAEARAWILSSPEAFCNTSDRNLLETLLPDFDLETKGFFRWTVEYSNDELTQILREKSGIDFGKVDAIEPLRRGPSGRILRLRIAGSERSVIVGKELEIRRWLSRSHLYSSAFIVETVPGKGGRIGRFIFHGAGWGHGVGLC